MLPRNRGHVYTSLEQNARMPSDTPPRPARQAPANGERENAAFRATSLQVPAHKTVATGNQNPAIRSRSASIIRFTRASKDTCGST